MIKEDVLQYLKDNFYLASAPSGLVITNKFLRELGVPSLSPISTPTVNPVKKTVAATKELYKLFIEEAKVPSKIETSSGAYWANRYSESGFKAFKKVFDDPKINRAILLAATKWYYAQSRTARKMIGTYFSEGIWESCYDDFIRAKKAVDLQKKPIDQADFKFPEPKDENASNMEAG